MLQEFGEPQVRDLQQFTTYRAVLGGVVVAETPFQILQHLPCREPGRADEEDPPEPLLIGEVALAERGPRVLADPGLLAARPGRRTAAPLGPVPDAGVRGQRLLEVKALEGRVGRRVQGGLVLVRSARG